jgi:hypothetical protein
VFGNFSFEEAVTLCAGAGIGVLIPHHFGMFDFNTIDETELRSRSDIIEGVQVVVPEINRALIF